MPSSVPSAEMGSSDAASSEAGAQAALLAPTEVLSAQHHQTITRMLGDLAQAGTLEAPEHATEVALLTGSLGAARRRAVLARVASGAAGLDGRDHGCREGVDAEADSLAP